MTINVISPGLQANYLTELEQDEVKISEAAYQYETAKALLDVSLRRYTALRDFVSEALGRSPYAPDVDWPSDENMFNEAPERGRFRFTGMRVGDAILQVLEEAPEQGGWLSLEDIIKRLSAGGLGFPESVEARAVNAALLKTAGIGRGKRRIDDVAFYRFVGESQEDEGDHSNGEEVPATDPDDLPFE